MQHRSLDPTVVVAWLLASGSTLASSPAVVINVNADGTVALVEGSTDIGGTRASIAMQAAETLGVPYEDVRPTVVGTDGIGFTDVTGGSRTTFADRVCGP